MHCVMRKRLLVLLKFEIYIHTCFTLWCLHIIPEMNIQKK